MFANDRSDSNALSTILTLRPCDSVTSLSSAATAAADTSKYSATSITRRKLKTKQKCTINLTHTMAEKQQQQQQNVALKSPSSSVDALSTLTPRQMSQQQAIFEIPATATRATTTTATKTATTTMHTKLEINPIKSPAICRPKRKKLTRQPSAAAHATPLKAIPLLKESIETFGMPARELHATRTHFDYDDKEIKVIKAVTSSVRPTTPPPPRLERNRSFTLSGLPANYDPFLSAKRQLEELCSPISPTDPLEALHTPKTNNSLQTATTPTTPNMPTKMSTSLTLSTSMPFNSSPLATSNAANRMPNAATPKTPTPTSNFRRASSLRGPRRSPLLPSRPLFAQKPRPTIQRGLSDEGPISSNFLKPEEYDEMPVRAVCVNDFAVTKSPRVVRRDTSNSNRKQSLKLNISPSAAATTPPPTALPHGNDERLLPDAKYLSKTDSLAVFLKYENELEKLGGAAAAAVNAATAAVAPTPAATVAVSKPALEHSQLSTPVANLNSPVITKELKDKSNNLSKQNSAKSIKLESLDPPEKRGEELQQLATAQLSSAAGREPLPKQNSEHTPILSNKHTAIRLEPISKPATPLSTPGTNNTTPYTLAARGALPSMSTPLPVVSQAINLNAIFGEQKPQMHSFGKERFRHSNNGEYIDPKLINKCDNLPVSLRTFKTSDSDSYERRHNDTSSSCSESSAPASASTASVSQLCKLLPLSKVTQQQSHYKHNERMTPTVAAAPAQPNVAQQAAETAALPLAPRNSAEGRHLLKRKMRLGRNQFLYDASPEADSCSADDEANRSSAEYDGQKFQQATYNSQLPPAPQSHPQPAMHPTRSRPALQTATAHNIPTLPIFDDFDFEEFLSSFEHDDEQFPLFKDCREFLLNRTSNKQRSTPTANSNAGSGKQPTPEKHPARQSPFQHDSFLSASTHTSPFPAIQTHFQFPNVISKPLLTSSSLRSHSNSVTLASKEPSLQSPKYDARFYDDDHLAAANGEQLGKREIFISIETEQNDLSRSPISPDSLRSMVGNPQAMVEVEVDANDNKFSRISDDEPLPPSPTSSQLSMAHGAPFGQLQHLPNVQLNNAKNLIQKMQDDFRQMSEEVGANIRQAVVTGSTLPHSSTAGGTTRSALSGATNNVSRDVGVDSDDMSSLDGYPISSQSSRRGVVSKLSADSAYGSLSRQRSSDMSTHRSQSRTRPSTASASTNTATSASRTADEATQHQQQQLPQQQQQQQPHYKYMTTKSRSRQFSGSSSSGSDNSLPPIATHNHSHNLNAATCNSNYQQQQQQQQQQLSQHYNNNNKGTGISGNNNNSNCESPLSSPTCGGGQTEAPASTTTIAALQNDANANLSHASSRSNSISSSAMSTSLNKMSKFCHECGSRFIIEHAKFCTDCGVRRIVL